MDDATRLMHLLSYLKISAAEFSRKTKINQSSVSSITGGERRITIEMLNKIIKAYPMVNIDWLLTGDGEPLKTVESAPLIMEDKKGEYTVENSRKIIPRARMPDEDSMRANISENLRIIGKCWKLTQTQMLELLGHNVGRQGASLVFKSNTMLKLPQLINLSRLTGWPVSTLSLKVLSPDEIPDQPLMDAPLIPQGLSASDIVEMRKELNVMLKRIAKFLAKMEQNTEV